jgi:hypothetical protein
MREGWHSRSLKVIGLRYIQAPTFSRQSANRWRWGCQPYTPAGRILRPERFLVLNSVRGWIDLRATLRLERLGKLINPVTSSGIETATCRLVSWCLNPLRYRVPQISICVYFILRSYNYLLYSVFLQDNYEWVFEKHLEECGCITINVRVLSQYCLEGMILFSGTFLNWWSTIWSTRHCGNQYACCAIPRWLWWRNWWNDYWQGKPKYSEITCPSAALSTTNPTCLPGRQPGPSRWEPNE